MEIDSNKIREKLKNWYINNKRLLPWRETRDPYKIWVSEIILQQTRVNQGIGYYNRFIKEFPTIEILASASRDKVLKTWEGMGYYSRARHMHETAINIQQKYKGAFPDTFESLLKFKGIGEYTAAAVASIAFKQAVPVVDGNVYRVLSRLFGVKDEINTSPGKRRIKHYAHLLLDYTTPHIHNQALMDFGALVCTPGKPTCDICPFQGDCFAFQNKMVPGLPVKKRNRELKRRFFYYLLIHDNNSLWITKRSKTDIWNSLYELPLIETNRNTSLDNLQKTPEWHSLFGKSLHKNKKITSHSFKHQLSHQVIQAKFLILTIDGFTLKMPDSCTKINKNQIKDYAFPKLINNFFNKINLI